MFKKSLNGIKVSHNKNTAVCPSERMPVPARVVIHMAQHMGPPCEPTVKVGDTVAVGQKIGDSEAFLSSPIFASVSGKVKEVRDFVTGLGAKCKAVVIESDGEQRLFEGLTPPVIENQQDLVAAARNCGLVGLGGAGFPTHIKLNPRDLSKIDTLLVNGAECEPYITSDNRLMVERTQEIVDGIKLIKHHLNIKNVIIGIEENKPDGIAALSEAVKDIEGVEVKTLNAKYPQGAEKVLAYECTGRVVPMGKIPADVGIIVSNITTVAELAHYAKTGIPLVEKTITVDGDAVNTPKNVTAPIGTQICDIVEFCGGYKCPPRKILFGGPMMGWCAPSDEMPIAKNTNAILCFGEEKAVLPNETACIRCGRCVRACPFGLKPAALDKAFRAGNVQKLIDLDVMACMECGCCAYVCPAKRHLVTSNALGKQLVREELKKRQEAK